MPRLLVALLPILTKKRTWLALAIVAWFAYSGGGASIQSGSVMPDLGIDRLWKEPRDVLVDRVEEARDAQQETITEFKTAMGKFKSVIGFDGGELEAQYERLNAAYERSNDSAAEIGVRIDKVTAAANALLDEWRDELGDYHDANMRRVAERQFDQTRMRAEKLIASMRAVERRTEPVLALFRDQVLYIKHNLNARAINALDKERGQIQQSVDVLIADMQAAIDEANAFIESLQS